MLLILSYRIIIIPMCAKKKRTVNSSITTAVADTTTDYSMLMLMMLEKSAESRMRWERNKRRKRSRLLLPLMRWLLIRSSTGILFAKIRIAADQFRHIRHTSEYCTSFSRLWLLLVTLYSLQLMIMIHSMRVKMSAGGEHTTDAQKLLFSWELLQKGNGD